MTNLTAKAEHLQWCKDRALSYVGFGDLTQALTSMYSDLGKHPETQGHPGIQLGVMEQMAGLLRTEDKVREFIEGFN